MLASSSNTFDFQITMVIYVQHWKFFCHHLYLAVQVDAAACVCDASSCQLIVCM